MIVRNTGAPPFGPPAWAERANLDRIQIVKGWKDEELPPVGNTVDSMTATYANTIGSAELIGSWTDPTFDPKQYALDYVRVLQIPTPRWTTYDAVRAGLPLLDGVPSAP